MKLKLDENLGAALFTLAEALKRSDVSGKTWIAEIGRIREYGPDRAPADD